MTKDFNPEEDLEFAVDDKLKEFFKESIPDSTKVVKDNTILTSTLTEAYVKKLGGLNHRIVFFDHKQTFFEKVTNELQKNFSYEIIKELEELPKKLAGTERKLLFLYYNGYPRLCAQMIPLVRDKFQSTLVVLVAKNMTAEFVKEHKESDLAADDYLSVPFSADDMFRIITKYN